jgi:hypothetical protein
MKEIMEKLLNDKASRDINALTNLAAGENNFDSWD